VKAATSLRLIGRSFGGEQIDHVEFEYGSASLDDVAKKKIDVLGEALSERPALNMDLVATRDLKRTVRG
jgi:hypothetical protein